MSRLNRKVSKQRVAGGYGTIAAEEDLFVKLRRIIATYLLFEERYYEELEMPDPVQFILSNIDKLSKEQIKQLIEETRLKLGLRHTPILCILGAIRSRNDEIRRLIGNELDSRILATPKDVMDLIAGYKQYCNESKTIPHQIKKLVTKSLQRFDEYQLAKYGRNVKNKNKMIKLVDVFNLVHPKPLNPEQGKLWRKLIKNELEPPMTWEVMLSRCRSNKEKRDVWLQLMEQRKLPALATIRNLRNMLCVGVEEQTVAKYIDTLKSQWIFPYQIFTSYFMIKPYIKTQYIPMSLINYIKRLSDNAEKLRGMTYVVLDISGSMGLFTSNSYLTRALAVVYSIIINCEKYRFFLTSGNDGKRKHATTEIMFSYSFEDLARKIENYRVNTLGYGGIFTAQCINWLKQNYDEPDRLIVVSDSQDCDRGRPIVPKFGRFMYNNNIAPYRRVAYSEEDPWTATFETFSSRVVDFIKYKELINNNLC